MTRVEELDALIKAMKDRHIYELAEKDRTIGGLKEQLKKTEYAFKGACCEHFTVRVELAPGMLASDSGLHGLRLAADHASRRVAHEVEHRLGDRYELHKSYDEAIRHIHYLENHAASRGVQFTPFATREFK